MTKLPKNILSRVNEIAAIAVKQIINVRQWDQLPGREDDDDYAFDLVNEAEGMIKAEGYRIGPMCSDEPMAFANADKVSYVAKWKNIDASDYPMMDGVLLCDENGFRTPMKIWAVYFG